MTAPTAPTASRARPRGRRRVVAAGAALGLAGAGLAGLVAQAAGTPPPAVTLVAGPKSVEVFEGDSFADYGLHVIAGNQPIEVKVSRKDLASPFVATLTGDEDRAGKRLPAGLVTPSGLVGFLDLTFRNSSGAVVARGSQDWIPASTNGGFFSFGNGAAVRYRPDSPDRSPWPNSPSGAFFGGGTGSFVLSNVFGLQRGWASTTSAFSDSGVTTPPTGRYKLTATISPKWRAALGITAAEGTASVAVKVSPQPTDGGGGAGGAVPPALLARSATVPGTRAGTVRVPTSAEVAQARQQRLSEVEAAAGGRQAVLSADPNSRKVPDRRPDLRANPAFGVGVLSSNDFPADPNAPIVPPNHDFLSFAATVWNDGSSPLVVEGARAPGAELMTARQFFYDKKGRQLGWTEVGSMQYDPKLGHQHWHFLDFAQYNLLGSDRRQLVRSQKEAFCLAPTDAIDLLNPDANWNPGSIGLFSQCGANTSIGIRETLDVGWGDTYSQFLPGQSFDITDLPNGTYYIQVKANPNGNLYETNTRNNESQRKIVLGGKPGARTVKVPPYLGNDVP